MLAVSAQKNRLEENECAKHMLQITFSGKSLAPLKRRAFRERNADGQGRGGGACWKAKIGPNPPAFRSFSMRSPLGGTRRCRPAAGTRRDPRVSWCLHCSKISIWGGGILGKSGYRCGEGELQDEFQLQLVKTAFRQRPRYREKTEEQIIHDLPLGELFRVALNVT